jgi:D-inositol-3-phosphate glycosyltransferase
MCVSRGFGGLELNTLKLAGWLTAYGWNVSMLVLKGGEMERRAKDFCNSVYTTDAKKPLAKLKPMHQWLQACKAQLVFTPLNKDIAAISLYKRVYDKNIKHVYQQQMQVGLNKKDFIHTFRYKMIDLWISPLNYLRDEVIAQTKVPAEKISVIPLGIEIDRYINNKISQKEARQKLQLPSEPKIIGVLGRIDPKKGQDFLIRGIEYIRNRPELNYHLLVMGNVTPHEGDTYLKSLYQLVETHQLQDRVHFRESTLQTGYFYSAIDVFGMPSHGETFGMVTVEAMASGKPVIGNNKDGTREILQYGKLGYLYEFENLDSFAEQLQALDQNKKIAAMIEAARREVEEKYTSDIMCLTYDTAFIKLLSEK